MEPVFKRLAVVLGKVLSARLHLQEQARPPEQVGKSGALPLPDWFLEDAPGLHRAVVAEGAEQVVAEGLRLPTFPPPEVLAHEADELGKFGGWSVHRRGLGYSIMMLVKVCCPEKCSRGRSSMGKSTQNLYRNGLANTAAAGGRPPRPLSVLAPPPPLLVGSARVPGAVFRTAQPM